MHGSEYRKAAWACLDSLPRFLILTKKVLFATGAGLEKGTEILVASG
jgi:hypothetical protein